MNRKDSTICQCLEISCKSCTDKHGALLTLLDKRWKFQHQKKLVLQKKLKKRISGTDPTYQHMKYYPVTLSSKQAGVRPLYDARNNSDLAKACLSPITPASHKKRNV